MLRLVLHTLVLLGIWVSERVMPGYLLTVHTVDFERDEQAGHGWDGRPATLSCGNSHAKPARENNEETETENEQINENYLKNTAGM